MLTATRNTTCGWYNWSVKEKRFTNVRSLKGGGTSTITLPKGTVTKEEVP